MTISLPASSPTRMAAEKLRSQVLEAVERGELKAGDRVVAGRKLAGELGVSYVTARRAIKLLVGEGLLETRPRQGVFVAPGCRRGPGGALRTRRVRGLFYLERFSTGYEKVAAAAARTLSEAGIEIVWSHVDELTPPVLARHLSEWEDDAFILVGPVLGATIGEVAVLGRPVVLVDNVASDDSVDCVVLDNEGATFDAAGRFLDAGHERVAYVGGLIDKEHPYYAEVVGAEWPNSILRAMGVRRAYLTRGRTVDESLFTAVEHFKGARRLGNRLFALPAAERPSAAVCFSVSIAAGLCIEAAEAGLDIPDEFAAVGMGTPGEGWAFGPDVLSHYAIDWSALGREAAAACLARLEDPGMARRQVVLQLTYVAGRTG